MGCGASAPHAELQALPPAERETPPTPTATQGRTPQGAATTAAAATSASPTTATTPQPVTVASPPPGGGASPAATAALAAAGDKPAAAAAAGGATTGAAAGTTGSTTTAPVGATVAATPAPGSIAAGVAASSPPGTIHMLESLYDVKEMLGKGHFAKVRRCIQKSSGKDFAVKIIDKKDLVKTTSVVRAEIEILKRVGAHSNVVSLVDHFEGEEEYYLVMELCKGGDLFTKIVSEGKYNEKRAVRICKQLASALAWIHKQGITHRDLKPENILLTSDSIDADIKVADFGLSKLMKGHQHYMRTVCGTWAYCAPEVISRKPYTQAVDAWTLGVLMFILLSGYHPFDVYGEMPEPQLLKKIKDCDYDFEDDVWQNIGNNAKDLIRGLLQLDPEKRMTIDQYLVSPWIMGEGVKDKPMKKVVERLSKFNDARKKFRALVLAKLVAGKFRASISHSRSPSHVHKIWTGGQRGSMDVAGSAASPLGDHTPSSPMSPPRSPLSLAPVEAFAPPTTLSLEAGHDAKETKETKETKDAVKAGAPAAGGDALAVPKAAVLVTGSSDGPATSSTVVAAGHVPPASPPLRPADATPAVAAQ